MKNSIMLCLLIVCTAQSTILFFTLSDSNDDAPRDQNVDSLINKVSPAASVSDSSNALCDERLDIEQLSQRISAALSQDVRELLAAKTDSNHPPVNFLEEDLSPEQLAQAAEAEIVIEDALSRGVWSHEDQERLSSLSANIHDRDRERMINRINKAINRQELEFDKFPIL